MQHPVWQLFAHTGYVRTNHQSKARPNPAVSLRFRAGVESDHHFPVYEITFLRVLAEGTQSANYGSVAACMNNDNNHHQSWALRYCCYC